MHRFIVARFNNLKLPILTYDDYNTSGDKCLLYPQLFTGPGTKWNCEPSLVAAPPLPLFPENTPDKSPSSMHQSENLRIDLP